MDQTKEGEIISISKGDSKYPKIEHLDDDYNDDLEDGKEEELDFDVGQLVKSNHDDGDDGDDDGYDDHDNDYGDYGDYNDDDRSEHSYRSDDGSEGGDDGDDKYNLISKHPKNHVPDAVQKKNLSINKLINLATSRNFKVGKEFYIGDELVFLELTTPNTQKTLLLSIPDRYRITPSSRSGVYIAVRKYQDVQHNKYLKREEDYMIDGSDDEFEDDDGKVNFGKCISRLDRYKIAVKSLPYTMGYMTDTCFTILSGDNNFSNYRIREMKSRYDPEKYPIYTMLFAVVDLTDFFENAGNVEKDIEELYRGIQIIGQKVRNNQIKASIKVIKNVHANFKKGLSAAFQQEELLHSKINHLGGLYYQLNHRKQEIERKLDSIASRHRKASHIAAMYDDIDVSLEKDTLSARLEKINRNLSRIDKKIHIYNERLHALIETSDNFVGEHGATLEELQTNIRSYARKLNNILN